MEDRIYEKKKYDSGSALQYVPDRRDDDSGYGGFRQGSDAWSGSDAGTEEYDDELF